MNREHSFLLLIREASSFSSVQKKKIVDASNICGNSLLLCFAFIAFLDVKAISFSLCDFSVILASEHVAAE
jgi:hypothetical protein